MSGSLAIDRLATFDYGCGNCWAASFAIKYFPTVEGDMGNLIRIVILSVVLGLGAGVVIILTPMTPANAGCSNC
jgi:hypothetical protein